MRTGLGPQHDSLPAQGWWDAGESKEEVLRSPFLERLQEEGLEVILFTDAIDEYMMQHLQEYDDRKLINISKDNLKLGGKDKDEKAADKALKVLPLLCSF